MDIFKKVILTFTCILAMSSSVMAEVSLPSFAYKQFPISEDSSDDVHELIAEAARLVYPDPASARTSLIKALKRVNSGSKISEYDYLWTQYGLLKTCFETGGADFTYGTQQDFISVAKNVLNFLDNQTSTGEWIFTEEGAFRVEVYIHAGNGLAWYLMESATNDKELNEALSVANDALRYMGGEEHYYLYDTKVRILLKLQRETEAFELVKSVLKEYPDFGDFQDFLENDNYQKWLKLNLKSK